MENYDSKSIFGAVHFKKPSQTSTVEKRGEERANDETCVEKLIHPITGFSTKIAQFENTDYK